MATINGISFQDPRNINLKGGAIGSGVIRFDPRSSAGNWASNPFSTDDYGLYINSSGQLVFSSLGSATVLGAAGGGAGVPTWTQIFAGQATFNVAGTTWTIDNSTGNNDVLTITNTGAGSGDLIQITNGGSGNDINGTSGTWAVTKTGAATFLSATVTTNIIGTTGLTLSASGAGVVTIGANTNTITMAKATTFSSTITVTDGLSDFISTSNAAAAVRVTNNTATTLGAGVSSLGVAVVRSTSLTTGNLLLLQAAEGTVTTGYYLNIWDSVSVASMFKVGARGVTTIAGVAAGGTNSLTITAGDVLLSDGSITMVDADNAATFSLTNNTATTASVVVVAGSGVFTGSTTTSFMTLTASGLTTGTVLYVPVAALTTGKAVHIVGNALTTGVLVHVTHTTSVIADGGSLMRLSSTSVDTGGATNGTLLDLSSTASTAGTLVKLTDTALTTGTAISVSASAMTTGKGLSIVANALTSGNGIIVTSSSTDATARGLVQLTNSGAGSTGTALIRGTQVVQSTNFRRILTESGSGVTLWFSNGTTANGALSGTAGDICFNGGSNKPEYCTGTTTWVALV